MNLYLVGEIGDRIALQFGSAHFVEKVTKDHLVKSLQDDSYQVVDVLNKKYYDAENNDWKTIKSK